ncbi:GNAT family N-acetyltransferase [Photobacterium damselae subsp. damselae]
MKIVDVTPSNIEIYYNLTQAYEAEFSPLTKKFPDQKGKFALDTEIGGNAKGFLLYIDEHPAGLAAIAVDEVEDGSLHCEVCDFYVVPLFRKNKAGQRFAHQLFAMMPGEWESKQIEGAEHAIAFWRRAIGAYTDEQFIEDIYSDPYWGEVTRQRFTVSVA